jgi:site-specific recombinase XerD
MEIDEDLELFLKYLKFERESSMNTLIAYKRDIKDFILYLSENHELEIVNVQDIDKAIARKYLEYLSVNKDLKGTTIRRKVYALNSFFSYLNNEGLLDNNPFQSIKMPKKRKSLPVFLSSCELDKLIAAAKKHPNKHLGLRDLICLGILRYTGCRRSELLNLIWEDIEISSGSIKFLGKGNKERLVPIHPLLKGLLLEYKSQYVCPMNDLVIKGQNGKRLSNTGLRKILNKYLDLAGIIKNITPHKIRHSFATELLSKGVDIRVIQQWLGHESISTTAIYTHVTFEQLSNVWSDFDEK